MLRSTVSKVMWVGRATVFLVGLAVILAVVFGVASAAFGANGGNFLLGRTNVATLITRLAGPEGVNGAMFEVQNNNAGADDTALSLRVQANEPPMKVNSNKVITNLNADKVDGHDAPLWAVVNSDGTRDRGQGVTGSSKLDTGDYLVTFNQDVSGCAYSATLAGAPQGEISTFEKINPPNTTTPQQVATRNSAGTLEDRSFHLIVTC